MTRALTLILSATLGAACAGNDDRVEYAASANVADPELVAIGPDVEVVAGAREPVFRTNNAYWLYRGDRWYRSEDLSGSWIRIVTPPAALSSITQPQRYANYRADTRTVYHRDLTTQREPQPALPQAPYPRPPQQQPPVLPDDPGTTDQVPQDPTMPSQPGSTPMNPGTNPVPTPPDDLGRPDRMRDR